MRTIEVRGSIEQVDGFVRAIEFVNDSALEVIFIADGEALITDREGEEDIKICLDQD